jgi:hypothetical protein
MYAWGVNDTPLVVGELAGTGGGFAYVYDFNANQYIAMIPPAVENGATTYFEAVNAHGVAVGARTISNGPTRNNAMIWSMKDGVTDLGLINGLSTSAVDINDLGAITGVMVVDAVNTPFLWIDGDFTPLGTLANLNSSPASVNNRNQIVGSSLVPNPAPPPSVHNHAYVWDGAMVELPMLPGHDRARGTYIRDDGFIAGFSRIFGGDWKAVFWHQGQIYDIGAMTNAPFGTEFEEAYGVSNTGALMVDGDYPGQTGVTFVLVPTDVRPAADATNDCRVGIDDLLLVVNEWGQTNSPADVNHDRIVGIDDLLMVIEGWRPCP